MSAPAMVPMPAGDVSPTPARRSRLGAYAVWQLRDYLLDKGVALGMVMLFVLATAYFPLRRELFDAATLERLQPIVARLYEEFVSWLALLGALFATNGIVSDDRKHGYYRFLFAKPVRVPAFYAQKFAVHLGGYLLVATALLVTFAMTLGRTNMQCGGHSGIDRLRCMLGYVGGYVDVGAVPYPSPALLLTLAMLFVALGGVGFLLSAAWRVDWLSFMTVYIVSKVLWGFFERDTGWRGTAVHLLPPVHKLDGVYRALARKEALPMDDLRWLVLYGLACFALGIWVVRRRPLATS
jgi:hypothetical protein